MDHHYENLGTVQKGRCVRYQQEFQMIKKELNKQHEDTVTTYTDRRHQRGNVFVFACVLISTNGFEYQGINDCSVTGNTL